MWVSERTTTNNINALKGKALKLIKSALIEAVTYDAGCGGNLNVLWLNGQDVEETSFTALNLLLDNCGTALDPSLYFFFTREKEEVINNISFQKKDDISGFGTVVGNLWAMFLVKVPAKVKFEKACIHLPDSILDQVTLGKQKQKFHVIKANYQLLSNVCNALENVR